MEMATVNEHGLLHVDKGNQRRREIGMLASVCPLTEVCMQGRPRGSFFWNTAESRLVNQHD